MEYQCQRRNDARPSSSQTQASSSAQAQTITSLSVLQKLHDEAFHWVNKGLESDENGDDSEALAAYLRGLSLINQILNTDCEHLAGAGLADRDIAKQMVQKVMKTKLQVEYRLQALQSQTASQQGFIEMHHYTQMDQPPSYEEATMSSSDLFNLTETDMVSLGDSIMSDEADLGHASLLANATCIFTVADGVQIFFITPEGFVSAPSYPTALHVYRFNNLEQGVTSSPTRPPAFLQVGDWVYPLVPGMSPAMRSTFGAYIFPNITSPMPDAVVGLMLPETLSLEDRMSFEQLLVSMTNFVNQLATPTEQALPGQEEMPGEQQPEAVGASRMPPPRPPLPQELPASGEQEAALDSEAESSMSAKISKGILVAADYISWGMEKGAKETGKLIRLGSKKLQEHLKPQTEPRTIDPKVQKGAQYARQATHVAVTVSSFAISLLGKATVKLGKEIAPHIQRHGKKLLPRSLSQERKKSLGGVLEVAASGLYGFGTVYLSLEKAAKTLAKNIADETVHVVHHKYGEEAGHFAHNTMYAAGNVAMTAHNVKDFGVKAVAKRAAKDTGKAVLYNVRDTRAARLDQSSETELQKNSHGCYPEDKSPL